MISPNQWLTGAVVADEVFGLRPDYVAGLAVGVDVTGGPSRDDSDAMLIEAERAAAQADYGDSASIVEWRDTFRAFGVKPRKARSSVDALTRRASRGGLPRINFLTDTYNATSVLHAVPIGAEDFNGYHGTAALVLASGTEQFLTRRDGEDIDDPPQAGEPVWRDTLGVTCRRWNWRQTSRTAIEPDTTTAIFIVDGLGDDATTIVSRTLEELQARLSGPFTTWHQRLIDRQANS